MGSKAGKAEKKPGWVLARSGSSSERISTSSPSSFATSAAATPWLAPGLITKPSVASGPAEPATSCAMPVLGEIGVGEALVGKGGRAPRSRPDRPASEPVPFAPLSASITSRTPLSAPIARNPPTSAVASPR